METIPEQLENKAKELIKKYPTHITSGQLYEECGSNSSAVLAIMIRLANND